MTITGKSVFTLFIVVFMAVFFAGSFLYSPKSQLLPLVISSVGLFLALVQLGADLFPALNERFSVVRQRGLLGADQMMPVAAAATDGDPAPEEPADQPADTDAKRPFEGNALAIVTIVSMAAFAFSLAYIPYYLAIPAFILFMLIVLGRQNPVISTAIAAGVGGFMFILFDIVLNSRI